MNFLKNVATLKLDQEKCTGCAMCTRVCPRGVLEMRDRKAAVVLLDACIECGACMKNCAFGAITVATGVGCAAALINAMITGGEPTCDCKDEVKGCC
ncbi:MAG: 4Fe-4S binding protein [Chitinispirillaceae bacterium]|nr:4Fe-4S binding protein [Chitinispirillaceae bacterium]